MSTPSLKLVEPSLNKKNPWTDDALEREVIAGALTNLFDKETKPLVISLHGDWGTGKTFLLKRWHQQLENNGQKAIYFNAWEDDFLGDPLIAIFGQLKRALQGPNWTEIRNSVQEAFMPILTKTAFIAVKKATLGFIELDKKSLSSTAESTFDEYQELHKAKEELKKRLTKMAEKITEDTGQPLVFIIDELDRCRPTFSIELLERVKHLFDIPNIVFVFGIDRNQLKSSIRAVYGDIDADGYLRRFFDMDFTLPPAKPDKFCQCLVDRHGLGEYFEKQNHKSEFTRFSDLFPKLCKLVGLSLREIEHCIRILMLACKNSPDNNSIFPRLLCVFLVLRIKRPSLYHSWMQGKSPAAKTIDYFDKLLQLNQHDSNDPRVLTYYVDETEILLYQACMSPRNMPDEEPTIQQLNLLMNGKEPVHPELLAQKTVNSDKRHLEKLKDACSRVCGVVRPIEASRGHVKELGKKIELAEMMLSD